MPRLSTGALSRAQADAVNDMEDVIDDGRRRSDIGRAQSSEYYDTEYEAVPLRGAGRSLAQRATAHLKALKKSAKDALKSAFGPDASSPSSTPSTYGNAAYESSDGFDVGSPRTASYLSRAHERTRSVDLRHVLADLDDTIEGAATAAQLLLELRESGGDPDAGEETNDMLDLELSDVCEAHRTHLTQVAQMSDDGVFVSEQQLGKMLDVIEQINVALTTLRSDGRPATASTLPVPVPVAAGATPAASNATQSLGSSRIEAASTEEEEERMIAEAIAQSLSMQTPTDELARAEAELPPPLPAPQQAVSAPAPLPAPTPSLEQLLAAPPTKTPSSSGPPSASTKVTTDDLLADLIKDM